MSIDDIVAAHVTYHGNTREAARNLPYHKRTILRHWKAAGLTPAKSVKFPKLNQQQISEVLAAYDTYDGNALNAAEKLGYGNTSVLRHWRRANLQISPSVAGQNKLNQQQIDQIVAAHKTYKGNSGEAAKHLPYAGETILKYWREARLETKTRNKLTKEQRERILAAHATYGGDPREAAKVLPHREQIFARYWGNAGLEVKVLEDVGITEEQKQMIQKQMIAAHSSYEGNVTKAARALHVSPSTLRRYWINNGLKPNTRAGSLMLDEGNIAEIIEAHFTYHGNTSEAARHLPYSSGTIGRHWRKAGLRTSVPGKARLKEEDIGEIIAAYATYNGSAYLAARKLRRGIGTITKYWREAGLSIGKPGQHG